MAVLAAAGPRPNASPHAGNVSGEEPRSRDSRLVAPPCACLYPRTLAP